MPVLNDRVDEKLKDAPRRRVEAARGTAGPPEGPVVAALQPLPGVLAEPAELHRPPPLILIETAAFYGALGLIEELLESVECPIGEPVIAPQQSPQLLPPFPLWTRRLSRYELVAEQAGPIVPGELPKRVKLEAVRDRGRCLDPAPWPVELQRDLPLTSVSSCRPDHLAVEVRATSARPRAFLSPPLSVAPPALPAPAPPAAVPPKAATPGRVQRASLVHGSSLSRLDSQLALDLIGAP